MPPITDKRKVRAFMDAVDEPLTVRRTRTAQGDVEFELVVEATGNLPAIVSAATAQGLRINYDGQRIVVEEPPTQPLATQVTPDPEVGR